MFKTNFRGGVGLVLVGVAALAWSCGAFSGSALAGSELRLETSIRGSIEQSLVKQLGGTVGRHLAAQVARLLQWRGDVVRNVHPQDRLAVRYQNAGEPQLLALRYTGAAINLEAFLLVDGDGKRRFFDRSGNLIEPHLRHNPVPGYEQITEVVQSGRGKRRHAGVDLKAERGEAVLLPYAGVVKRVNWLRRVNGNCVEVVYDDGKRARFLHLYEVDGGVTVGKRLAAGTRLGGVGSTGRSGAPHLHYEILDERGRVVDPLRYHGTDVGRISKKQLSSQLQQHLGAATLVAQ